MKYTRVRRVFKIVMIWLVGMRLYLLEGYGFVIQLRV